MRKKAAIALDIDGTMTTADPEALKLLRDHAAANNLPELYINTARDEAYCTNPSLHTTKWVKQENSFCRPTYGNVVEWKIQNMNRMVNREGVYNECAVLVDDRPENINGVKAHNYIGIKVDPLTGITKDTVRDIFKSLKNCGVSQIE
tara:strand:+ start:176 stop:616 length:441 start_codon:yes stop_codon:yes gene_type:complete